MEQTYSVSGNYAWGQGVDTYRGLKQVAHTGSWVGFTTYYVRYPDRRTSVVIFCNSNVVTAYELMEVRDLVLDPADPAEFIAIRFVRVRVVGFQHRMLIPFVAGIANLDMPEFSTVLPRESLGVPREGAVTPCG